jgi:FMN-dependent NADH-azoreductase
MTTLLRLDSSIDPVTSVTRRLTARFADRWASAGPDRRVVIHDLVANPVPHLAHESLHWAPSLRAADAPVLAEAQATQDAVIAELLAADVVVIGAPMYNYSIPSTLKTWIDHVHVPGVLAPFGDSGQPLKGRLAVVVTARGAVYDAGSENEGRDHTVPPIDIVLGDALGMRVETVAVSRTLSRTLPSMAGESSRFEAELTAAEERIDSLAASS